MVHILFMLLFFGAVVLAKISPYKKSVKIVAHDLLMIDDCPVFYINDELRKLKDAYEKKGDFPFKGRYKKFQKRSC